MYTLTMLSILALGAPGVKEKPKEPAKKEFSIVGNWKPSAHEIDGKELKQAGPEAAMSMMFTPDNRIAANFPPGSFPPGVIPQMSYQVNTSVEPHQITLALEVGGMNKAMKGLVKIQNKKLIIIMDNEGAEFPKSFETKGTKYKKVIFELAEESKPEKK